MYQEVTMIIHYFQMFQASMSILHPTDHMWPQWAQDSYKKSPIQIHKLP